MEALSPTNFQPTETEVKESQTEEPNCKTSSHKTERATVESGRLFYSDERLFNSLVVSQFGARVFALIQSDLGMTSSQAEQFVVKAMGAFLQKRFAALVEIARELEINGIGDKWNAVLFRERSECIASWIAPFVFGNMLDMLCGDGSVGSQLALIGKHVTLTEREESYNFDHSKHELPFLTVDTLTKSSTLPCFETVLLSTVLHHESNPELLLSLAAKIARRRIIIVENCLENSNPTDFQLVMDIFFNHCLNQTSLYSPGHHRSAEDWVSLVSLYGNVCSIDRRENIPGIPLSHHLIVIDVEKNI